MKAISWPAGKVVEELFKLRAVANVCLDKQTGAVMATSKDIDLVHALNLIGVSQIAFPGIEHKVIPDG